MTSPVFTSRPRPNRSTFRLGHPDGPTHCKPSERGLSRRIPNGSIKTWPTVSREPIADLQDEAGPKPDHLGESLTRRAIPRSKRPRCVPNGGLRHSPPYRTNPTGAVGVIPNEPKFRPTRSRRANPIRN